MPTVNQSSAALVTNAIAAMNLVTGNGGTTSSVRQNRMIALFKALEGSLKYPHNEFQELVGQIIANAGVIDANLILSN